MIPVIHQFIIYNRKASTGSLIFDDHTMKINMHYLMTMINSLNLLSADLDDDEEKGALQEIELGEYQISIVDHDELYYIAIQDALDNEIYSRHIINNIIYQFHPTFSKMKLSSQLDFDNSFVDEISDILQTLTFPSSLFRTLQLHVDRFLGSLDFELDTFFLSDLDNGIVTQWMIPEENDVSNTLMEILSEMAIDKTWLAEVHYDAMPEIDSFNRPATAEFWVIQKVELSDFSIIARGYYIPKRDYFVV